MGIIVKPNVRASIRGNYTIRKVASGLYMVFSKAYYQKTDDERCRVIHTRDIKLELEKSELINIYEKIYQEIQRLEKVIIPVLIPEPDKVVIPDTQVCSQCIEHKEQLDLQAGIIEDLRTINEERIKIMENSYKEKEEILVKECKLKVNELYERNSQLLVRIHEKAGKINHVENTIDRINSLKKNISETLKKEREMEREEKFRRMSIGKSAQGPKSDTGLLRTRRLSRASETRLKKNNLKNKTVLNQPS